VARGPKINVVTDHRLLNIGAFSLLTGLSIDTLRHYDDIDLLVPAEVDPSTSYRRYRLDQVARARRIRALRAVDLPIDEVRDLVDADDEQTADALRVHRTRLEKRHETLTEYIETLDDYIENGVRMPQPKPPCRVAEVNLGVDDVEAARRFYEATFQLEFTEDRHDDGFVHLLAAFGSWPSDEFFLLNICDGADDPYRAGRASFGFLVDDLDGVHKRAIAAGGTEIAAPHDASGMPRCSAVVDPSNNLLNLYQNA
jgi:DNA-binding transcriptional MerR regulator